MQPVWHPDGAADRLGGVGSSADAVGWHPLDDRPFEQRGTGRCKTSLRGCRCAGLSAGIFTGRALSGFPRQRRGVGHALYQRPFHRQEAGAGRKTSLLMEPAWVQGMRISSPGARFARIFLSEKRPGWRSLWMVSKLSGEPEQQRFRPPITGGHQISAAAGNSSPLIASSPKLPSGGHAGGRPHAHRTALREGEIHPARTTLPTAARSPGPRRMGRSSMACFTRPLSPPYHQRRTAPGDCAISTAARLRRGWPASTADAAYFHHARIRLLEVNYRGSSGIRAQAIC